MNVRGIPILSSLVGGISHGRALPRYNTYPEAAHNVVLIKIMDINEASKINEIDVPGVYLS